jgi:hypothetical protein
MGAYLLFLLALGSPCWVVGCGEGDSSKPAPINKEQQQKVQQYLGGYKEQLIAEAKKQAEAKAQAKKAGKTSP